MLKRILAPILICVFAGALFAASAVLPPGPWITVGEKVAATKTEVKAKELTLVCPGAAFASGGDSGTRAGVFSRIDGSVIDYSSSLPSGVSLKTLPLTGPQAAIGNLPDTGNKLGNFTAVNSVAITARDPSGRAKQSSLLLSAQSYQVSKSSNVLGALGANCQNPSTESWFIGAATTVGREALLILANPTQTDATVSLEIFGEQGLIEGAGLNGISVSANRTVVLPLAAYAPMQKSLAVHVTVAGAALAGWLQERTVRGTRAAGADLVGPAIGAEKNLVVPGLFKRGTKDASALIAGNGDYSDLTPTAQVFNPGTKDSTVTVQVIGSDSKTLGTVAQQRVTAGSTAEIPLTSLKDGNYAVFVVSDQPVLAAVRLSRTNATKTPNTDFTWLPAVAPKAVPVSVTVPKSGISKLAVANPNSEAVLATVSNLSDGTSRTVRVPQLGSAVVELAAGSVVAVSAPKPVSASLIADFDWLVTAVALLDYRNSGGALEVLVR